MGRALLALWLAALGGLAAYFVSGAIGDAIGFGETYAWISAVVFGGILAYGTLAGWTEGA